MNNMGGNGNSNSGGDGDTTPTPLSLTELPKVVPVPDQPCQQLYEANPVLLGFDVVYYHQIPSFRDGGVAKQGLSEHAYNFNGYQFWFINNENRQLFNEDPWKYAPAWGGFCSWGIAKETRETGWPWQVDFLGPPASPWEGWMIIDGVLTFNIWSAYTDLFMLDAEINFQLAIQNWKAMFDGSLYAGPFNTHCIGHGSLKNWCLKQQPSPWLQPLPECTYTEQPSIDGSNTTVVVTGGGIVSELESFDDFSNGTYSPYQRRWIIMSVIGLPIICAVVGAFTYYICKSRGRCNNDSGTAAEDFTIAGNSNTGGNHNMDEEEGGIKNKSKEDDGSYDTDTSPPVEADDQEANTHTSTDEPVVLPLSSSEEEESNPQAEGEEEKMNTMIAVDDEEEETYARLPREDDKKNTGTEQQVSENGSN